MICEQEVRHPNWLRERLFTSIDGESIRDYLTQEQVKICRVQFPLWKLPDVEHVV